MVGGGCAFGARGRCSIGVGSTCCIRGVDAAEDGAGVETPEGVGVRFCRGVTVPRIGSTIGWSFLEGTGGFVWKS